MEELVVYLRKEYFRAVDLTDKSGHILEFKYMPKTVDVYEKGLSVFHMEYVMENRTKVRVIEFYLTDFGLRGKGYGTACMNEIVTELGKKGILYSMLRQVMILLRLVIQVRRSTRN